MIALNATYGYSNDSWESEVAHFAGSAVLAGVVTGIADHYEIKHRAGTGFLVSAGGGMMGEIFASNGFSWLDFGSEVLGAGLGSVVTDRYILKRMVYETPKEGLVVGLRARIRF
jgi:uncharacterized protein YfiM (DUF2279 family)